MEKWRCPTKCFIGVLINSNFVDVHNYLTDAIPDNSGEIINALKTIKLNFGSSQYNLLDVKKIIASTRLDQFKLASLFGKRNFLDFFRELEKLPLDTEDQIGFYRFMQGHLFKLMDISYIAKKPRPSKYDKEIQAHAALWDRPMLQKSIRSFAELEIEAKKKNPYIKDKVRELLIAQL